MGFMGAYGYKNFKSCGTEFMKSGEELGDALRRFENESKYLGMKDVLLALKDIPATLLSCHMATTGVLQVAQLIEDVLNPKFFTKDNVESMFINTLEAHHMFSKAATSWKAGDCHGTGEHLAEAVQLILSEPIFSGSPLNIANRSGTNSSCGESAVIGEILKQREPYLYYEYKAEISLQAAGAGGVEVSFQVAAGLAEGFGLGLNGNGCLHDISQGSLHVFKLVKDLMVANALGAVMSLAEVVEEIYPLYKACYGQKGRMKDLLRSMKVLRHPHEVIYDLKGNFRVNGMDLSIEMAAALLAYEQKDWHRVGSELGKMLAQVIVGDGEVFNSTSPNSTSL